MFQGRDNNGVPYEELFCNSTGRKGIVMFGDSASAHFHLPAQWLKADKLSKVSYSQLMIYVDGSEYILDRVNFAIDNIGQMPRYSFIYCSINNNRK